MKRRVIVVLIFCILAIVQNPVWAATVTNWTELNTQVNTGNTITVGNDIHYDDPLPVINNTLNTTSVDINSFSISGKDPNVSYKFSSIFDNSGTISVLNGTIKDAIGATVPGGSYGAINNTGTLNLTNVNFTNNRATNWTGGGAIYNTGGIVNITANGADVIFSDNSTYVGKNDIYMNGGSLNLDAEGSNSITFNDEISGTGAITKTGTGDLNLNTNSTTSYTGDYSKFTGTFTQEGGNTTITGLSSYPAKFFSGISTINSGILNFKEYSDLISGSNIILNNSSIMNVYDNANIEGGSVLVNNGTTLNVITNSAYTFTTFNAAVSGSGDVTRSGDNTSSVNFGADNHLFTGTFTQTGGQTYSNNGFFGGTSNIQGGTLELDANSHLYSGSNIYLTNAGTTMNVTNYGGKGGGDITLDVGSSIDVGSGTNLNIFSNGTPIDMNTSLSGTGTFMQVMMVLTPMMNQL